MQKEQTYSQGIVMNFRTLLQILAEQIGHHHFPLRDQARDIHELLTADAVHCRLVQEIVRAVYRENRCGHLDARVEPVPTFAALGHIRRRLAHAADTDIDQINFIEEIGWSLRQIFDHSPTRSETGDTGERAAVVAFPSRRVG